MDMTQVTETVMNLLMLAACYGVKVLVAFLKAKKEAAETKMGADKYALMYTVAQSIFSIAEEEFKGVAKAGDQKRQLFDTRLLQMFPTLTQDELDHFRQAVVGEFNMGIPQAFAPIN